jgi:hypothetical protein
VASLTTASIVALTTKAVAALTTASVASLTTASVASLQTADVAALTTASVASLTTASVASLETADVAALRTASVASLTTASVASLTTAQVSVLTTNQKEALTSAQVGALSTAAIGALGALSTPIILDLNGDGVKTLSISDGVKFDMFADGKTVQTGWVSSGDGLLVMDRNQDGKINDGSEFFGSSTTLANGQKAPDGYAALRELDNSQDGVISQDDAVFNELRVWVDSNSDGVTESGELKSLSSLGITQIDLQATVGAGTDNGNVLGLTSTYQTTDGATHAAADVWFATDRLVDTSGNVEVDNAIAALGSVTPAVVPEVSVVMPVVQVAVNATTPPTDLRSRVSGLAQAIGSFSDADSTSGGLSGTRLETSGSVASSVSLVALTTAVGMADVMKQFDANGNQVLKSATTTASLTKSLNLPGIQDPVSNGFLSTGGK